MWIDTNNCVPLDEGQYMVQTRFNKVCPVYYTPEGGWNTSWLSDGTLDDRYAMNDGCIVRWFKVPMPEDWVEEQ